MGLIKRRWSRSVEQDVNSSASLESVVTKDADRSPPKQASKSPCSRSVLGLFHRTHRKTQSEPWFTKIFESSGSEDNLKAPPTQQATTPENRLQRSKRLSRTRSVIGSFRSKITSPGSTRARAKTLSGAFTRTNTASPRTAFDLPRDPATQDSLDRINQPRTASKKGSVRRSSPIEIPSKADLGLPFLDTSFLRTDEGSRRKSLMSAIRFMTSPTRNHTPLDSPAKKREGVLSPMPGTHFSLEDVFATPQNTRTGCTGSNGEQQGITNPPANEIPKASSTPDPVQSLEDPFVTCKEGALAEGKSTSQANKEGHNKRLSKSPNPTEFEGLASRKTRDDDPQARQTYCGSDPLGKMSNVTAKENIDESSKRLSHKESMKEIPLHHFNTPFFKRGKLAPASFQAQTPMESLNAMQAGDNDTLKECIATPCRSDHEDGLPPANGAKAQSVSLEGLPSFFTTPFTEEEMKSGKLSEKAAQESEVQQQPMTKIDSDSFVPQTFDKAFDKAFERSPRSRHVIESYRPRNSFERLTDCSATWGHWRGSTETTRISTAFTEDERGYHPKKINENSIEYDQPQSNRVAPWAEPTGSSANTLSETNRSNDSTEEPYVTVAPRRNDRGFAAGPMYDQIANAYEHFGDEMRAGSFGLDSVDSRYTDHIILPPKFSRRRGSHSSLD